MGYILGDTYITCAHCGRQVYNSDAMPDTIGGQPTVKPLAYNCGDCYKGIHPWLYPRKTIVDPLPLSSKVISPRPPPIYQQLPIVWGSAFGLKWGEMGNRVWGSSFDTSYAAMKDKL